ncbi:MAG TPA: right-handed parallel beta-helix repeat-containing protein [Catenuloplanes sp.]|jgi:hypothetical protein
MTDGDELTAGAGPAAGGALRRVATVASAATVLAAFFFAGTTDGPPARAAAAALQLVPPVAGRQAVEPCTGTRVVTVTPTTNIQTEVNRAENARATFCFEPGVYRHVTISPKAGQRFIGKPGQPGVVLTGASELTGWKYTDEKNGPWWVEGQRQNPTGNVGWDGACQIDRPMCRQPEELFVNNVVQRPVSSLARLEPGTWFFDHAAARIYVGSSPLPKDPQSQPPTIETSITREAFTTDRNNPQANVEIANMLVEKYASIGHLPTIGGQYPSPGWVVRNMEVRLNHGGGINLNGGRAYRNYVHHNGHQGITGTGTGTDVDSNEIAYNNTAGYAFDNEGGAGKFSNTVGLKYRNNYVHDNHGMGAWTDINNRDTLYENNIVDDNDGAGIMHEISFSATIRNNLLRGNGRRWSQGGIFISTSSDVTVTGNTVVVGPTSGLANSIEPVGRMGILILHERRTGTPYCPGGVCVSRNNTVENNTVEYTARLRYLGGGQGFSGSGIMKNPTDTTPSNNVFRGNTYVMPDCREARWFWVDAQNTSSRDTFAQWQAHGNDTTGTCRSTATA